MGKEMENSHHQPESDKKTRRESIELNASITLKKSEDDGFTEQNLSSNVEHPSFNIQRFKSKQSSEKAAYDEADASLKLNITNENDEENEEQRSNIASDEEESEYSEDDERYITDVSKRKEKRRYIKSSEKKSRRLSTEQFTPTYMCIREEDWEEEFDSSDE